MASRRLLWLGCVILIVACSHGYHSAHAQSLVAVARLAREMREQVGPPGKIYTTADLPGVGRVTEPTLAWVSRYLALVEAALERERVLQGRRRERPMPQSQPARVPAKTMRSKPTPALPPPPRPTTSGIPLSLVYGAPVILASPHQRRPRDHRAVSDAHDHHAHGVRPRSQRSADGPAARKWYEPSSRLFLYVPRGLPAPGTGRYATRSQATGDTRGR